MADFTALKTAIQNAIKQNGNEEITGNLLQDVLLAIVTTLGEGNINNLINSLDAEVTARQQAVSAEAQARQLADSTLQGGINIAMQAINAINNAITNGCVYAGIATPSSTPASGKVFYLALTAGTYTNFNSLVVPQGINVLKNNDSTWLLDSFLGIDDTPTPSSNNLIKSGGAFDFIMKNGSAFDLSAYNNGTTYADLNAALTALNALPAAYKRGGMSMKYVQTYDNKYMQYRLMSDSFNTTPANWQGVDDEPTAGSDNLVESGGVKNVTGEHSSNASYNSSNYSDIWWASNKQFIQVEESGQYNTFIVRVAKGQTINWSITSYVAINVFSKEPVIGDTQDRINEGTLTNPYTPESTVYVMFMVRKSESMTLNVAYSSYGLSKEIEDNATAILANSGNVNTEVIRAKAAEDKITSEINEINNDLTITNSLAGIVKTSKNYAMFKSIVKSIKIKIDDATLVLPAAIKLKVLKNSAGNYQTTIQFVDKETDSIVFSWYVNNGPLTGIQEVQIVGTGTLDTSVRLLALVDFDAITEEFDGTEFIISRMNKQYCYIDNDIKDSINGNWADVTTVFANQYYSAANIASTGKMVDYRQTNNGVYCTRLDVRESEQYRIFGYGLNSVVRFYAITDESLNVLATNSADINSRANGLVLTMPATAKYLYINFVSFNSTLDRVEKNKLYVLGDAIYASNLKNKTIAFFGDSITEFEGYDAMSYPKHFARISGANILNFGIGGTQYRARVTPTGSPANANQAWADVDISSLVKAIADNDYTIPVAGANWLNSNGATNVLPIINRLQGTDFKKVDIVVLFGGTNDWGSGAGYLGETGSTDSTKTLGAINNIVTGLLTAYPHLKIYVFTPIVRWGINTNDARTPENWCDVKENAAGDTLPQYVEAIKTEFEKYKLPICDMYYTLGWNQYNFNNYFNSSDGTHPYLGFNAIAKKVFSFIVSNL